MVMLVLLVMFQNEMKNVFFFFSHHYLYYFCLQIIECPGGRQNPCTGHGTCSEIGECQCEEHWFGPMCDKTCAKPGEDPATACTVNGRCYFDGVIAQCECYPGHVGERCDKLCPKTADVRAYTCSLRGECAEKDGETSCLCHLGFKGDICEDIDFDGSGLALSFKGGRDAINDVVYWDLPEDKFASLRPGDTGKGLMTMMWVNPTAYPPAGQKATLVRWKYANVQIDENGIVSLCDATADCAKSAAALPLGKWTFIAAAVESTGTSGTRRLSISKPGNANQFAETSVTAEFQPLSGTQLRLGEGFNGLMDMISITGNNNNNNNKFSTISLILTLVFCVDKKMKLMHQLAIVCAKQHLLHQLLDYCSSQWLMLVVVITK